MLLFIQQLLMLIIQFVLNSFKKEQKEKTGIDYQKAKQLLNSDIAKLRSLGINPSKLSASTWYMDSKNLEKQKEASSIWGKTFGMTRETKKFSQFEEQQSNTKSQSQNQNQSYDLSGTSGLMKIYFPFITNLFAVDDGELPRDVRIPTISGGYTLIQLFEIGTMVASWQSRPFSPLQFEQEYQHHYDLLSMAQRISVGTSVFKKVTEIALNSSDQSIVEDIPRAWEYIINAKSDEVLFRDGWLKDLIPSNKLKIPIAFNNGYSVSWNFWY